MKDLIARLEAADVGSRELDALIWMELVECDRAPFRYWSLVTEDTGCGTPVPGSLYYAPHCAQVFVTPDVTTSIDAALALAERVLPAKRYLGLQQNRGGTKNRAWTAFIEWAEDGENFEISPAAATPALALCAAVLRAKEPS